MEKKDLILVSKNAQEMLVNALTEYVRDHGEEMSEYYYNEFGMDEEDEDGVKILKVLNTSETGCFFSKQFKTNDESLSEIVVCDEPWEVIEKLDDSFSFSTYWAFYIVREADGTERLKYYRFYNDGVTYDQDSDPDHNYADLLGLDDLHYIIEAIISE